MPNCDFYGALEDHKLILDFLFEENECEIYELSSDFEKPLKQFFNSSEILKEFERHYINGKKINAVHLQLNVLGCGLEFVPRLVELNPSKCDGFKFRYNADGYSLVQLYLEIADNNSLSNSHTNHNTQKRAEKWARSTKEKKEVASCDFNKITKFSSKLNRFIRKVSVGKLSSRPVLPYAYELWQNGVNFGPFNSNQHEIEIK